MTTRTLDQLQIGQEATVKTLNCTGANRRRLMDLGVLPGTRVKADLRSPLGDPTAYLVRGASIALRKVQAEEIEIDSDETAEAQEGGATL